MKTKIVSFICGVVVACLAFASAESYGQKRAPERTKWEYKIGAEVNPDEKVLNDLGAEGWELAGVGGQGQVFFKRPR